jgi:hypothetical protein
MSAMTAQLANSADRALICDAFIIKTPPYSSCRAPT